jgi:ABC-type spermidine/putrescine transport system permease subunit II
VACINATALHAVTFINIWAGYPFYMVSLLAGLQGVPGELYEASIIDGANEFQKFWYITIPQLLPIIITSPCSILSGPCRYSLSLDDYRRRSYPATEMLSTLRTNWHSARTSSRLHQQAQ